MHGASDFAGTRETEKERQRRTQCLPSQCTTTTTISTTSTSQPAVPNIFFRILHSLYSAHSTFYRLNLMPQLQTIKAVGRYISRQQESDQVAVKCKLYHFRAGCLATGALGEAGTGGEGGGKSGGD
ncbi:hypothetical protein E2C01_050550 [Portunus trituberculatus]|uniref:Uncharacterized protein n=1 Tax=Portunus trituberculatus TaxID=210409 RepID=A0A5B7GG98_PORTR|nr:hypothetical protein [Portunus trituberculatus]